MENRFKIHGTITGRTVSKYSNLREISRNSAKVVKSPKKLKLVQMDFTTVEKRASILQYETNK